jgi:hypothetical protein
MSLLRRSVLLSLLSASAACTSVETATVGAGDLAGPGEAMAVIQGQSLGFTALFHYVDLVHSDLDTVVNKLLVAQAKAMGASRVELKTASTTPRSGVFALVGAVPMVDAPAPYLNLLSFTNARAVGVAIK